MRGLEFATNLESLALADNRVTDLSPLAPATVTAGDAIGSPVGLPHLKHLSLDFNPVTDLSALAQLVDLESLSVDGQSNLAPVSAPKFDGADILSNPTPSTFAQFGQVVAASEDYVAVSSPFANIGSQTRALSMSLNPRRSLLRPSRIPNRKLQATSDLRSLSQATCWS